MLPQEHTEHGRLGRILIRSPCQVDPGAIHIGREKEPFLPPQTQENRITGRLLDLLHTQTNDLLSELLQHRC
jgi:hypothetical protein